MSARKLPNRRNEHIAVPLDKHQRKELAATRRLGQTYLDVGAGKVGTSNATKPDNLGQLDYAHIRIPLPKDLRGSEVFHKPAQDGYYFMRRSSDGYISASGLFKGAFPWATLEEESAEKEHFKSLPGAAKEEVAGSVWVPPQTALDLADEYDIRAWVEVLLDSKTIEPMKGTTDPKSPPVFKAPKVSTSAEAAPAQRTRAKTPTLSNGAGLASDLEESPKQQKSPRKRAQRSMSPTKASTEAKDTKAAARKIATPKKPSGTKRGRTGAASASVEPDDGAAATTTKPRKASGRKAKTAAAAAAEQGDDDDKVTVKIDSTTETNAAAGTEAESTRVSVETPARHPHLKLPEDAQGYLDSARKAIDEANRMTSEHKAKETLRGSKKRKAADISADDVDEEEGGAGPSRGANTTLEDEVPAAKRARLVEIESRRDKIKRRATYGAAASLVAAYALPFITNYFGI